MTLIFRQSFPLFGQTKKGDIFTFIKFPILTSKSKFYYNTQKSLISVRLIEFQGFSDHTFPKKLIRKNDKRKFINCEENVRRQYRLMIVFSWRQFSFPIFVEGIFASNENIPFFVYITGRSILFLYIKMNSLIYYVTPSARDK